MNKWLTTIGIALLVISVALVTPLKDYLPVDFWQTLSGAMGSGSGTKNEYYKVVPTTEAQSNIHIYVLITLGIIFVGLGMVFKPKGRNE